MTGEGQQLYREGQQFGKRDKEGQNVKFVIPLAIRCYAQEGQEGQNILRGARKLLRAYPLSYVGDKISSKSGKGVLISYNEC